MKKRLQILIVAAGIVGSIFAFNTAPRLLDLSPLFGSPESLTYIDMPTAIIRGGGVLLLAIVAFAGVTFMIKDD